MANNKNTNKSKRSGNSNSNNNTSGGNHHHHQQHQHQQQINGTMKNGGNGRSGSSSFSAATATTSSSPNPRYVGNVGNTISTTNANVNNVSMNKIMDDYSDDGISIGSYSGTPLSVTSTESEEQWGHEFGMRTFGYVVSFQRDQFGFISWRRKRDKGDVFFAEYVEHNLEAGELVEFEAFWNDTREMWNGKRVRRARMTRGQYVRKGVVRALGSDGLEHEFNYDAKSLQNDGFYCRNLAEGRLEPETPVVFFLERDTNGDERVRLLCVVERGELKKFYDHKNCGFLRWSQSKDEDKHSDPFFWCSYSGVEAVRHFFNFAIPFHFAPVKTERGRPEALYCFAESLGTVSQVNLKEEYLELSWFPQSKTNDSLMMNIRVDIDDLPEEIDLNGIHPGDQMRFDYYFARAIVVLKELIVQGKADGFPNQRALKLKLEAAPAIVSYDEAVVEGDYEVMTGDKLKVTLTCLPPEMCDTVLVMKLVIDMADTKKRHHKKKVAVGTSANAQQSGEKIQPQIINAQQQQQQQQQQLEKPKEQQQQQLQQFGQMSTNDQSFQALLQQQQQQVQSPLITAFSSLPIQESFSQSPALGASEFQMSPQLGHAIQNPPIGQSLPLQYDISNVTATQQQQQQQQQGIQITNFLGSKGNIFSGTMFNNFFDVKQQQRQPSPLLQQLNSSSSPFVYPTRPPPTHNQILNDMNSLLLSPQAEDSQSQHAQQNNGTRIINASSDSNHGEKHISADLTMYNIPLGNDQYSQLFKGRLLEHGARMDVAIKCVSKAYVDQSFHTEIKTLTEQQMNTDHMTRIKCTREDEQNYYIVMEYCECISETVVQSLGDSERLRLVNDLIQAVSFCHSINLVHCAIRPSNVMMTSNSKLKLAGDVLLRSVRTNKVANGGIPREWNAREIIAGDPFRSASDIFSLGLMVFYILSGGKHPFQVSKLNSPQESIETNIMKGTPSTLIDGKDHLDRYFPGTTNLIYAMLQMDPKWRPHIDRIRKHPLAWSITQCTQYLEQLDILWNHDTAFASKIDQTMKDSNSYIGAPWPKGRSWYEQLPGEIKKDLLMPLGKDPLNGNSNNSNSNNNNVVEVCSRFGAVNQKPSRYNVNNCTDLVRFVHNANKYLTQQQQQQQPMTTVVVEFLKCFPNLIHYTYSILLEHQRDLHNCLKSVEEVVGAPLEFDRGSVKPMVGDLMTGNAAGVSVGVGFESTGFPGEWTQGRSLRRASPL